jgi:hypothetical protein
MYLEIDRQTDKPTNFVVIVFVCTEELCNAHHDLQDSYGLWCLFVALWTFFHSCGLNNQTSVFQIFTWETPGSSICTSSMLIEPRELKFTDIVLFLICYCVDCKLRYRGACLHPFQLITYVTILLAGDIAADAWSCGQKLVFTYIGFLEALL